MESELNYNNKEIIPFIRFKITDKCNYHCEYCTNKTANDEREKTKLDINASDNVINNFMNMIEKLDDPWEIRLGGGETLLHPRFFELLEFIVSAGHKIQLTTNFSFPIDTYKELANICGENLTVLCASLHLSQITDIDDFIKKAIQFNNSKHKQTGFVVVSVLTEENFKILKDIKEKFDKENIRFDFLRLIIDKKNVDYSPEIEEYLNQNSEYTAKKVNNSISKNSFGTICNSGYKSFNIGIKGDVKRCYTEQKYFDNLGNIEQRTLKLLHKPMPCLSKECQCCNVFLKNNIIEFNRKGYFKAYYFFILGFIKQTLKNIKKELHYTKTQ